MTFMADLITVMTFRLIAFLEKNLNLLTLLALVVVVLIYAICFLGAYLGALGILFGAPFFIFCVSVSVINDNLSRDLDFIFFSSTHIDQSTKFHNYCWFYSWDRFNRLAFLYNSMIKFFMINRFGKGCIHGVPTNA